MVAEKVARHGGRTFFVGGCVRDMLMGRPSDDVDIEVHDIEPDVLESILSEIGEVVTMGTAFGVYGLRGSGLDIAMPRLEDATGIGHRDFKVFVDPHLGLDKAARRRDFTINAMMQDVMTGELFDFYGGLSDIHKRILRHIDDEKFREDPLRVLRAAQFSARLEFSVAPETDRLMSGMDLGSLAKERVFDEMRKALEEARMPSRFFSELKKIGQLHIWFPELERLIGTPQDPDFHPEGDVWNHTMQVVDAAAELRDSANYPLGFMLSAVVHDLGKADTTEKVNGHIHSFNHDIEGVPVARKFLARLTSDRQLTEYVLSMVELHMRPALLASQNSSQKAVNKLFDLSKDPEDLILLAEADCLGCGRDKRASFTRNKAYLEEHLKVFRSMMAQPCVTGKDLVDAGLKPGPEFSEILGYSHKLRLAGIDRNNALKQTLSYARYLEKKRDSASSD